MIRYKDILGQLSAAGYPPARLRKEKILGESTMQRIRQGGPINTATLDTVCRLLNCQPNKVLEYVKDDEIQS